MSPPGVSLPQGVVTGAYALLPETGGDRRTRRERAKRGTHQVLLPQPVAHPALADVPFSGETPSPSVPRDVDIWMPEMEQQEVPAGWWDGEADRSLLAGVFKHGERHEKPLSLPSVSER